MSAYRKPSGNHEHGDHGSFGAPGAANPPSAGNNRGAGEAPRRRGASGRAGARGRACAALCLFLLASCTVDGADPDPAPADTVQVPASTDGAADAADGAADAATSPPPDEATAEPAAVSGAAWTAGDTRESRTVTGAALLRDMRTARHDGFDRIVFDFGADNMPSYEISYIDRPVRQCGSGDTVPFAGDAWLSVVMQPANAHTEEGVATVRERARAPGLPVLLELKMICDFEAMVEVVAGVSAPEPYRAFVLREPSRLVVDIRHSGRE